MPPFTSPAGASAAAAWAAAAIQRVVEAQAAEEAFIRVKRAFESQDDADELVLGEDGQPVTLARLHGLSEEAIRRFVEEKEESEARKVLASFQRPIGRREVRLHEADDAARRAAVAAVETSVAAVLVAERACAGGVDASSLPPVMGDIYEAVRTLGIDATFKFSHAFTKAFSTLTDRMRSEALGPPPSLAGP
jgi:hypothetical protein